MQRLVDVGHQMQQPGQGIRNLLFFAGRPQQAAQALDLPVRLAIHDLSMPIDVDVMPAFVPRHLRKARQQFGGRVARVVEEARVVTNVVRPGRGFGENGASFLRARPCHPALVVRVAGQRRGNEFPARWRQLLPGDGRRQAVAGRVPCRGERWKEQQAKSEE